MHRNTAASSAGLDGIASDGLQSFRASEQGGEATRANTLDRERVQRVLSGPEVYKNLISYQDERSLDDRMMVVFHKGKRKFTEACRTWSFLDWLSFIIPCIGWLRTYKWRSWLLADIVAGFSVGFMVVPQGMAYANTARLPTQYGLYGAFIPCIIYCLVGSSRQLAVGPVAVTSLLIAANLGKVIPCIEDVVNPNQPVGEEQMACQDKYNHAAIQLAFIVACMYTGVGVLRLGWITKFLSHAVIGGFTTGAAIIIAFGQLKYILGYSINMGESTRLQDYIREYTIKARNLVWQEYIMGVMLVFVLIAFKEGSRIWRPLRYIRPFGALTVCIMGLCAVYIGGVDNKAIKVIGNIPAGLPSYTGSWWVPMTDPSFTQLIGTALVVMVVDLLESTSIARALARKNGYELVYNREIVGLGLANFAGALFNSYTTTGSFSRSAVNDMSGAKTPLAQFVCGWIVGFVLLFLTNVFKNLPFNAMGAIVIIGVTGLVEWEQAVYLWKVNKLDLVCFLASCLGTLFYSIEIGLAIAIGLAVMLALYNTAFPHTAVLGKIVGTTAVYRNIKQYPDAQMIPGVLAFRIDAPVYYANAKALEDKLEKAIIKYTAWSQIQGTSRLHFVIIDMTPVVHCDSMGLHFLEDLVFSTRCKGIVLMLANPSSNVVRAWEKVRMPDLIGREHLFVSMHDAMMYAQNRLSDMGLVHLPVAMRNLPTPAQVMKEATAAAAAAAAAGALGRDSIDSLAGGAGPSAPAGYHARHASAGGASREVQASTGGTSTPTPQSGPVGVVAIEMRDVTLKRS